MTLRTLNEIRSLDHSNYTLRFNRTAREAGVVIERRMTPAGRFWIGYAALVVVAMMIAMVMA